MAEFCSLIRWIITYAVTGGFWHFVAVYVILNVLVRTLGFVRVNIENKTEKKSEDGQ